MGKKRLGDLYRTHMPVECEDDTGEKITVTLYKISRPDSNAAGLAANAKRALVLMRRNDPSSEMWLEAYGEITERSRQENINVLTGEDYAKKLISAEAEEAAEERWSEDDYLDSLRALWADGVSETWVKDPDDPDASRVHDELEAFQDCVDKRMEGEAEDLAESYRHLDDEELRVKVVPKLIDTHSNLVWLNEFELHRIFYATREPLDRSKRYFRSVDEVRDLDERIFIQLRDAYDELAVDAITGKGSPATHGSSPPSEPSTEEGQSTPSGPEMSTASKTSPTSS